MVPTSLFPSRGPTTVSITPAMGLLAAQIHLHSPACPGPSHTLSLLPRDPWISLTFCLYSPMTFLAGLTWPPRQLPLAAQHAACVLSTPHTLTII